MSMTAENLIRAAVFTVKDPRAGARAVLDMGLSLRSSFTALFLMAVGSTMLSSLTFLLSPMRDDPELARVFGNPMLLAVVQVMLLTLVALLIYAVGRRFGGGGDLPGAVVLTAWLEFVLILIQVMQLVALLTVPILAEALGLVGFVLFIGLLTRFIMELHGFSSTAKVVAMIFATFFTAVFALSVILAAIILVMGGSLANV